MSHVLDDKPGGYVLLLFGLLLHRLFVFKGEAGSGFSRRTFLRLIIITNNFS